MGQADGMTRGRPVCQLLDVTSSFHRSRCPFSSLRLLLGCSSPSFVSLVHPYNFFSRHPHDTSNFFPHISSSISVTDVGWVYISCSLLVSFPFCIHSNVHTYIHTYIHQYWESSCIYIHPYAAKAAVLDHFKTKHSLSLFSQHIQSSRAKLQSHHIESYSDIHNRQKRLLHYTYYMCIYLSVSDVRTLFSQALPPRSR